MAIARKENLEFHTKSPVPAIWPALIEPREFDDKRSGKKGDPKYSVALAFAADSEDLKTLKSLALQEAKSVFPNLDVIAEYKAKRFRFPWTTGEEYIAKKRGKIEKANKTFNEDQYEWYKGKVLVRAASKNQPALGYVANGKGVDLVDEGGIRLNKDKFYSGALSFVQLNLSAFEAIDEYSVPGVTAYLQRVLSTGKGERIGGIRSASETFSAYLGQVSDVDPTEGMDEIPF